MYTNLQFKIRKSDILGDQLMNIVPVIDKMNHERNRSELSLIVCESPPNKCIWVLDLEEKYTLICNKKLENQIFWVISQ